MSHNCSAHQTIPFAAAIPCLHLSQLLPHAMYGAVITFSLIKPLSFIPKLTQSLELTELGLLGNKSFVSYNMRYAVWAALL